MKILVFSDSHLTEKVDKRIEILEKLLNQADQVIINGDFWDGYLTTFDKFVNSPWKKLFPLFKKKKTVYVQGNHDKKLLTDQRVNLFSELQATNYYQKLDGKELIFEHGNRIMPAIDDQLRIKRVPVIIQKQVRLFHDFLVKKYGKRFLKFAFERCNQKIKKKLKKTLQKNQLYICGHTHYAEVDEKNQFANSGIFRSGLAQYLLIEDGKFSLKEQWYT